MGCYTGADTIAERKVDYYANRVCIAENNEEYNIETFPICDYDLVLDNYLTSQHGVNIYTPVSKNKNKNKTKQKKKTNKKQKIKNTQN